MKKIYVCSALRGDMECNIENARRYCEFTVREYGFIPIAPHIYFTQFLEDNIESERKFGLEAGLSLLSDCDELWYFGKEVTSGMAREIETANRLGIPVVHVQEFEYAAYLDGGEISYEGI